MAQHCRRLGCFMKVSQHGASVGIVEKIHHRAMAAGDENSVILIQAGCDDSKSKVSPQPPLTLGSDFSGVVEKVGPGVTDFAPADQIYGVTNPQFCGAQAEFAVA